MHLWLAMLFGPYSIIAAAIFAGARITSLPMPWSTFGLGTISALVAETTSVVTVAFLSVGHVSTSGADCVGVCVMCLGVPFVGVWVGKLFALPHIRVAFYAGFFGTLTALAWTCRLIFNISMLSA